MPEIEEYINAEGWSQLKKGEGKSIRFSPISINNLRRGHLKKIEKKREQLIQEREYITDKKEETGSILISEIYAKRIEKLSDKIRIVNYQIDAIEQKISYRESRTPKPIKVAAAMLSKIYGAYRFAKKFFNKITDKIVKINEKIDNYGETDKDNIDVYEESNKNSDEIKNNIEKGFANMAQENRTMQTEMPKEVTNDAANDTVENTVPAPENATSEIPKPRDREVYETDGEYVNHLKEFYSEQFPNIDMESNKVNASHINTNEEFKTADDVINQVVGLSKQPPAVYRNAEPIQIAEERQFMPNNNVYNNDYSLPNYDSSMTMQSEGAELRQLRDKLKELNDLINDKQQKVANRHARLTEQEKNIVAQEHRNEELYAKVNELLNSKREKIDKLTAEEKKSQQRGQTLNERQAQVMQEQEALEMMLNEGNNQNTNMNSFTM